MEQAVVIKQGNYSNTDMSYMNHNMSYMSNYMNHNMNHNNHNNKVSWRKMVITAHSTDRAKERLGISSQEEIKKEANKAKYNGINIDSLNIHNYEKLGIKYEELTEIKKKFYRHNNTEKLYYYKNFVWIFCNKGALTLRTVVPVRAG